MKICIKENEFNPSLLYQGWCTEEKALQMGYKIVVIHDNYSDCHFEDFNEDLTFSLEKYNARKQKENAINYKREIEKLIALKYDIYDELAIQRQKDTKPEEYQEYYNYVEQCKKEVKEKYGY
jgi:hypothetical protein